MPSRGSNSGLSYSKQTQLNYAAHSRSLLKFSLVTLEGLEKQNPLLVIFVVSEKSYIPVQTTYESIWQSYLALFSAKALCCGCKEKHKKPSLPPPTPYLLDVFSAKTLCWGYGEKHEIPYSPPPPTIPLSCTEALCWRCWEKHKLPPPTPTPYLCAQFSAKTLCWGCGEKHKIPPSPLHTFELYLVPKHCAEAVGRSTKYPPPTHTPYLWAVFSAKALCWGCR